MIIRYHKKFEKRLEKMSSFLQEKIFQTINKFSKNPFDPTLKNHALQGQLAQRRAFSVTGNIRIIFEEHANYTLVIMLDVGTHNQVYE